MLEGKNFDVFAEMYPHLASKIRTMWGHPELNLFLSNMFTDTRDGKREGFPLKIASFLMDLQEQHHKEFPGLADRKTGIYSVDNMKTWR